MAIPVLPRRLTVFASGSAALFGRKAREAIILGSASMTGKAVALEQEFGCPIIDPIVAGVAMIDSLTRMCVKSSKLGAYRPPVALYLLLVKSDSIRSEPKPDQPTQASHNTYGGNLQ
jgi:hypothetical protein